LILSALDPEGSELRKARRLRRRIHRVHGPNHIWHMDAYDKLKPFGFGISGCIDGFSREIIWLTVYHTNSDPRIIAVYYYETVSELHACPLIVQGDRGTENGIVKLLQTRLTEQQNGKYLEGASTANQRIESF